MYCDDMLRKKQSSAIRGMNEEALDSLQERIMTIFKYIFDKDAFEHNYKAHLAKVRKMCAYPVRLQRSFSPLNSRACARAFPRRGCSRTAQSRRTRRNP